MEDEIVEIKSESSLLQALDLILDKYEQYSICAPFVLAFWLVWAWIVFVQALLTHWLTMLIVFLAFPTPIVLIWLVLLIRRIFFKSWWDD